MTEVLRNGSVVFDYNFRIRCVSGNNVPHPVVGELEVGRDGYARIVLQGLTELMQLVEWWDCPVTISAPGGTPATNFWLVEIEDGLHGKDGPAIYDAI